MYGGGKMVTFTLNGKVVSAKEGTTILEAAKENGVDIPHLCYDKNLSSFGGCRLCVVEVEGAKTLIASCTNEVREGMVVQTESENVVNVRKDIIDLLLASHPEDCLTCEQTGNCKLQDYAYRYGVKRSSYKGAKRNYPIESLNPVMERDQSKCILCGKCVRVCKEVQVTGTIDFANRGFETKIATAFDDPISTENCRLCGQCISVCPTGAIVNKQLKGTRPWEVTKVRTTCPFCGVGCNFDLNVKNGKVVGVTPNPDSPVNGTSICVKGRYHVDMISNPDRLKKPLAKKNGEFVEISWDEALHTVTEKLKEIKAKYGPDAIAGLSSARCTNEENFLFQKMMRVAVGTNSVDHCART
jgi:predicted molibdopterin-dependent oxidoreductase YjgC